MIDKFNEVFVETLEVHGNQQKIVNWLIPATLPFNEFIKIVADKEKSKNIDIAVETESINQFIIREKKYMQLN